MLREMRPSELGEFMALNNISPWTRWRDDFRVAQVCSLLAEIHRDRKKRSEPYTEKDFMLDYILDRAQKDKDVSARIRSAFLGRKRG